MLCNLYRSIMRVKLISNIALNNFQYGNKQLRCSSNKTKNHGEIKAALDIEANLFENSLLQHEPVAAEDILRKYKMLEKPKQKRPQIAARITNYPTGSKKTYQTPSIVQDEELDLEFVRLNLQDPLLSTLLTTARSRKRRDKDGQIIIEGRRLIAEALACGLHMQSLIFSQREQLQLLSKEVAAAQRSIGVKVYKVPQHDLKIWSTLTTPPGLLGIFERPAARAITFKQNLTEQATQALPITVVCDNIRESNNLGSIIRTCAALPCLQVVVTRGCCDPWETKALRGGCGGQFRLPIHDDVEWDQLSMYIPPQYVSDCHVYIAENNLGELADKNIPTIEYSAVQGTHAHNIVIIGGEAHGVSDAAYKFLNIVGMKGKCVYIPLAAGVDSLNVTSALTLILFELRKHLI